MATAGEKYMQMYPDVYNAWKAGHTGAGLSLEAAARHHYDKYGSRSVENRTWPDGDASGGGGNSNPAKNAPQSTFDFLSPEQKELLNRQYELYGLQQDRTERALKGELPITEASMQRRAQEEAQLNEEMTRRLGPDWKLSTPGLQILSEFDKRWNLLFDAERHGEVTLGYQAMDALSGNLQNQQSIGADYQLGLLGAELGWDQLALNEKLGMADLALREKLGMGQLELGKGQLGLAQSQFAHAQNYDYLNALTRMPGLGTAGSAGYSGLIGGANTAAGSYAQDRANAYTAQYNQSALRNNTIGGLIGGGAALGSAYLYTLSDRRMKWAIKYMN